VLPACSSGALALLLALASHACGAGPAAAAAEVGPRWSS
jgi:hypothetical protein